MLKNDADAEDLDQNTRRHSSSNYETRCARSPPASPLGCSCFCLTYPNRKPKKSGRKGKTRTSQQIGASSATQQLARTLDEDDDVDGDDHERWCSVLKQMEAQRVDAGELFDVEKTENAFKKASLKEKQLTREARKLLETVNVSTP